MGIEPADRAVAATIDNIHPAAAGMLKYNHWSAREIEFGDGRGDRKGFELFCSFRHDDGVEAAQGIFVFLVRLLDKIVLNLAPRIRRRGGMALEPGFVAAQPAFNLVCRLVEAKVGFVRSALGVQAHSRAQTQSAIRTIAGALARHHHMAADRAAEIAGDRRLDFFQDVLTQSFPDVEVLARYPQGHRTVALPFRGGALLSPPLPPALLPPLPPSPRSVPRRPSRS